MSSNKAVSKKSKTNQSVPPTVALAEAGQSLIEIVLAIAIASIFLAALATTVISAREAFARSSRSLEANILLQKEAEAVRSVRESGWNSIASPGIYHTEQETPPNYGWEAVPNSITEGNFTRSFAVENVCRSAPTAAPIDCSSPTAKIDPSTKKITVNVSWAGFGSRGVSSTFHISRYFGNQTWTQTTKAQFDQGTTQNTLVTDISGGEVRIKSFISSTACPGSWQNPMVCQFNGTPVADGRGVFISGDYAYMVGGDTATNADFFIYDISNPESISLVSSIDLGAIGYNVFVSGNYAYVATGHASRELTVVDISNKANPQLSGSHFNTTAAGQGVFVSGNTVYLVTNNNTTAPGYEFYAINITNPLSPTQIGGRNLGAAARNIFVSGNYAYVASTSNTQELQVVNLLNFPAAIGIYDASGNSDGLSVYVVNTTAYLAAGTTLYLLNVTNPSSIPSTPIGTYDAGGTIYTVFVSGNYAFIGTSNGGSEFQVINISNPASPGIYGSTNLNGTTYGLYIAGDYAFLANTDNAAEFQVIKGGADTGIVGCRGDWQNPMVCQFNGIPVADGRGVFISGDYAYMVGGDTATNADFFIYDISNPESISLVSSIDLGAIGYNVFVSGNYAYVATAHDTRELTVVDVSNKSAPSVVGGYNITAGTGTQDGRGIYVVGTRAYLSRVNGTGADFFVLDVSNPLSIPNPPAGGTIDLAGNGYDVFILGNYAYIATSNNSRELDVINIANPTNITRAGWYSITENTDGLGIFVVGSTAYLTTTNGASELYVLNVSNPPLGISQLGSLDLGGAGNDVFVDGNYAFIGTSNGTQEFQVIDVSNPASPGIYGSTNLNGTTYGLYIAGDYAFLANTDNNAEFQVIRGGTLYNGNFISSTFNASTIVGFNYLTWAASKPAGTNIRFQIATNNDGSTWKFAGPDGYSTTFYTAPGAIPLQKVAGHYIRYKFILSSNINGTSPVVENVTVNYSP